MDENYTVGRLTPVQGAHIQPQPFKGFPKMTEQSEEKSRVIETLTVKIDCDTSAIAAATDALKELASAADKAREALDALFAGSNVVTNVSISGARDDIDQMVAGVEESIKRGARTSDHRFKL